MLVFVKLGGSLITDKHVEASYRGDEVERLAGEMHRGLQSIPDLQVVLGHGSGSFGHFAAKRHDTIHGVRTSEQWRGFAEVSVAAADLNHRVAMTFHSAGVPVWRLQPSASAQCHNGHLESLAMTPVHTALAHNLVPLVYGDVALDDTIGGTIISTEVIFAYLARRLQPNRILLLGEVAGVYDSSGDVIPVITRDSFETVKSELIGASGVDVTGGMLAKVQEMLDLAAVVPDLEAWIVDGRVPDLLESALLGNGIPGTRITAG
jgi:isopentenyl phosphate kinase